MKLDQTINLGLGALSLLLLAACDSPPNRPKFADITFQHRPAISLDVGSVQIEAMPAVGLSAGTEDVSAEFPQAPAAAVNQWVRDRLRAVGVRGQADVTIIEARATRTPLPRSSGLDAALRKEQSDRYDLALEVRINAFNPVQGVTGSLTERVTRSQTVLEDLTLNQREAVLYNMLDAAMKDLDARLEQGIRQHLGPLIR
jgi:hypothetical protein